MHLWRAGPRSWKSHGASSVPPLSRGRSTLPREMTDMGFLTPMYELGEYLTWTRSGEIQLPDFQRGYKWEDERIRQLLVTILRGHPLGVVMLLKTGNDQIRFKPRPIEGVTLPDETEPDWLLLDGQQRLTSLTQALTGAGVV